MNNEKIFTKTENLIVACISINLLHMLLSGNRLVLPVNRDTDKLFYTILQLNTCMSQLANC